MPTIIDIVPVKSPTTGTGHTISSTIISTTPNSAGVRYAARRYCWLTHTGTIARSPILYSLQDEAPSTQCGPMVYITSVIPFACVDYSARRCEGTTYSVLPTAQVFPPPLVTTRHMCYGAAASTTASGLVPRSLCPIL